MRAMLLLAAIGLAAPAFAHDDEHHKPPSHAKKGEHADAPRSFETRPPVGTWARCSVSGDVFKVDGDTRFATYQGRVYAFCCPDCKPDFDKDPAQYADKTK